MTISPSAQANPDGLLYHYTSQAGLLGILQAKQIWATNLLFFNDSMELNYAVQMIQQKADKIKGTFSQKNAHFIGNFIDRLSEINYADTQSFEGIYVCSFSRNGDQLSQWRGYCPDSGGFSIGFDFNSSLRDAVSKQGFRLVECIYDERRQSDVLENFVEEILVMSRANDDDFPAIREAWEKFLYMAPLLKHPKFEEEQEWRLISEPRWLYGVQFRVGASMLIPYVPINIFDDTKDNKITWIPEIRIGPTPHPNLSYISLEHLLRMAGVWRLIDKDGMPLQECNILISEVPYRVW